MRRAILAALAALLLLASPVSAATPLALVGTPVHGASVSYDWGSGNPNMYVSHQCYRDERQVVLYGELRYVNSVKLGEAVQLAKGETVLLDHPDWDPAWPFYHCQGNLFRHGRPIGVVAYPVPS
jgi:hypothetical protein